MRFWIAAVLVLASTIALGFCRGRACWASEAQPSPEPGTRGEDWSVIVGPDGNLKINYKGAPAVQSSIAFWGPKWKWAGGAFKGERGTNGESQLTSQIAGLKTNARGTIRSTAPNILAIDLEFTSAEDVAEAVGGGWDWQFKLDDPILSKVLPTPALLDGQAGWAWKTGPDQAITLKFDPPAAKVYLEGGAKNRIRTFFLADGVKEGAKRFHITLTLPEGGSRKPSPEDLYDPVDTKRWFRGALAWDASPVDLRFLNKDDRPAGRRGFVKAVGDRLIFEDGTPARFWGGNLAAYALFSTPRQNMAVQARRMAELGYNLMRIHHHDSVWVHPNIFDAKSTSERRLDAGSLDALDWWIKCLRDEGIYVWLDMEVGRQIEARDHPEFGAAELLKTKNNLVGFNYYNPDIQRLMKEFQEQYLSHVNPYTKLAYKDDPAVVGVLVTNENDLVNHFGNRMLPDKGNPFHTALFTKDYKAFASEHGLPEGKVFQTWAPGPSKIYLNDVEHRFNEALVGDLRSIGVRAPIATTNHWGNNSLYVLPALTDGDVVDVHSYGKAEELSLDPRREPGFVHWIGGAQVSGKPLTITEWNVPYPIADRFTAPLYVAGLAALQGWDAPMIYTYSQDVLRQPVGPSVWSSYFDPAITGVMPAAALLYRRGHVAPAKKTYHLALTPARLFDRDLSPKTSATIRTLVEQSRLTIGLPAVKELSWLTPSQPPEGAIVLDDPDRDMLPQGASEVRSDTGELARDWDRGIQLVDTSRTQAVSGWIGGKDLKTADARFQFRTKKAVVALTSIDDQPLARSRFILVTAVARAVIGDKNRAPLLSEPVVGAIALKTEVDDLQLLALAADGKVVSRLATTRDQGVVSFTLPAGRGTHWFVLKSKAAAAQPAADHPPQPAAAPR